MYRALVIGIASLALIGGPSEALVLCAAKSKKTGEVRQGAVPRLRSACQANEASLDPAAIGIRGPEGPQGPVGPSGPDLTGSTLRFLPADGSPAENGAALIAALAAITDASATKPYTLHLAPGIYDVGSAGLDLIPYLDLEGSGRERTIITGSGSTDRDPYDGGQFGTIRSADATMLRALTVRNTGGAGTTAVGVYLGNGRSRLQDVIVQVAGGDTDMNGHGNFGVAPSRASEISAEIIDSHLAVENGMGVGRLEPVSFFRELLVKDSSIEVTGGGGGVTGYVSGFGRNSLLDSVRISISGGGVGVGLTGEVGKQFIRNSSITVTGGSEATGLGGFGPDFTPVIENTRVQVSGATTANRGIVTNNGTPRILASRIEVAGPGATALQIGSNTFRGSVEVKASILSAATLLESFQNNPNTRFRIGGSHLVGSTITKGTGSYVCADSHWSSEIFSDQYSPLTTNCTR